MSIRIIILIIRFFKFVLKMLDRYLINQFRGCFTGFSIQNPLLVHNNIPGCSVLLKPDFFCHTLAYLIVRLWHKLFFTQRTQREHQACKNQINVNQAFAIFY